MKDIAIYGAGGFGKEVACLIERINKKKQCWNLIGFFDDGIEVGKAISHYGKVIGGIQKLNQYEKELDIVIAIGNPLTIKKIHSLITNQKISFPNVIDPYFYYIDKETFHIGQGNIIQGGCYASCDVSIGNFNVLNGNIGIGHDGNIGDFNVIMPNVIISGEVNINECNQIGVGSIILQQLTIGKCVKLGAGSVLMTKPKDNSTYIGNPAKIFKF